MGESPVARPDPVEGWASPLVAGGRGSFDSVPPEAFQLGASLVFLVDWALDPLQQYEWEVL